MNKFLLIINILLAIGTVITFGSNIETLRRSGNEISVPKRQPKKVSSVKAVENKSVTPATTDENIAAIINGDIFNPERTPNTGGPNSGRSEMTLAGTFKVGKVSGAIVIQRNRQRQFGGFMPQFAFGPGGRFGGNPGAGMRNADGSLGSMRMRFTQFNQQNNNIRGGGQSGQLSTGNRQSVKVGETLSNGYTLIEVGRASATLVRGSDRVELVLQDPSKVKNSGRTTAPARPTAQQMMQAHMATQRQMINVMQSMQRTLSNGGGSRGFGGGRGGRR